MKLAYCGSDMNAPKDGRNRILKSASKDGDAIKHGKFVKIICWSPSEPMLASASADGTVQITSTGRVDCEAATVSLEMLKSLHFNGAVEAMCFLNNGDTLCCYVRGTSYLSYFDLRDGYTQRKMSLNGGSAGAKCFDEHVSFAVLSLLPSPDGEYLVAATDASRNIVFKTGTERIVRNLYGHKNDGFSTPKIAWSKNGQYLYGEKSLEIPRIHFLSAAVFFSHHCLYTRQLPR